MLEKKLIAAADVEAHVVRDSTAAFLCTILIGGWAYWLLPQFFTFPVTLFEQFVFALHLTTFPMLVLLVAVLAVSFARRQSATDGLGSAYSTPTQSMRVKVAFLQNTLEQTVLLIVALLIASTLLVGDMLALLPAAVVLFVVGRISFYFGYRKHPLRRAFGMALTLLPAIILYTLITAMLFKHLIEVSGYM